MARRTNLRLKKKRLTTKSFGRTSKKPINRAVRIRHVIKEAGRAAIVSKPNPPAKGRRKKK